MPVARREEDKNLQNMDKREGGMAQSDSKIAPL
jgi:hypothetical protein